LLPLALTSQPQNLDNLSAKTTKITECGHPTAVQHKQLTTAVRNRRDGFGNNNNPIPIRNQDNFMRILQKSLPNKEGFVSWHNMACIKLRGYQVEIIRTFVYNLGITYWRLRYLVPKAANILSHTNWVQIESLYFNVMITPHEKTISLGIFMSVTLAQVKNKQIITSKDPDMLMEQLTPIPNIFSTLQSADHSVTINVEDKIESTRDKILHT